MSDTTEITSSLRDDLINLDTRIAVGEQSLREDVILFGEKLNELRASLRAG